MSLELTKTGRVHFQGAMCLGKQTAFKTIKQWFAFETAHIEPMRGTPHDSRVYCTKEALTNPKAWIVEKGSLQPSILHWHYNLPSFSF